MSREIRRVPSDWEHPMDERNHKPLLDGSFDDDCRDYYDKLFLWQKGEHPTQRELAGVDLIERFKFSPDGHRYIEGYRWYHEWAGMPCENRGDYMEHYIAGRECTHFQLYETVSEGTPVSPVFATKEDLVEWMKADGFADWAIESIIGSDRCPTAIAWR